MRESPNAPEPSTCKHVFRRRDQPSYQWRLIWDCVHCGYACHCQCFERAIRADPVSDADKRWQHEQLELGLPVEQLEELPFHPSACELCRGLVPEQRYPGPLSPNVRFGTQYRPYIEKKLVEMRLDGIVSANMRVAENALRLELGKNAIGERHHHETELYRHVQSILAGEKVIHHYRARWLQGLELDIYVPTHRLGVEYQGLQHFEPVATWGGEAGLEDRQRRDARKALLCREHGITLVNFTYQEELTDALARKRLAEVLPALPLAPFVGQTIPQARGPRRRRTSK